MSDLPGYEPTAVESPKKPRRKPVKKRRKLREVKHQWKTEPVVKKRRKMRKVVSTNGPVNPVAPREFEVVQSLVQTMLLLDRTTAKAIAKMLGAIFT